MFAEFFREHPLETLLLPEPPALFPPASDRASWNGLPAEALREISALAQTYADRPYPMRKATDFLAFVRTGSRQADEAPYFLRRRKLCAAVLLCCAEETAPLDDVIDGVWCICEETSWVISAHNINPIPGAPEPREYPLPDKGRPYIDLFSAQTGMILSLTAFLLGDRLRAVSPVLTERIRSEILDRILTPFRATDDFWWMGVRRQDLCNWTPWILSNVMLCAVLRPLPRPELAALLTRAGVMLDRWLAVVPRDGGCDEGAGYWNMAGGALCDCLELLEEVTGGRAVFWQEEKIRNILSFPQKAELGGGWFVNFADCDARPLLSGERLQLAGEKTGDPALAAMGRRLRGSLAGQLDDVPHFSRLLKLLFHPAGSAAAEEKPRDVWLPDLQMRMVRRGGWTLACKGGHNGESHNHNDVGSFLLFLDGEPVLVDAGNMVYTAKTFSGERYSLWNVRSAWHNLPLPAGQEQQPGAVFAAREVECLPDGLRLDIAGAYGPEAGLQSLRRELKLTEDGLELTDRLSFREESPAQWVFLFRQAPKVLPGRLTAGPAEVTFPRDFQARVETIPVTDSRMARSFPGALYRAVLSAPPARLFNGSFRIRRSAANE